MATAGVGVEIAADEAELEDAPAQFRMDRAIGTPGDWGSWQTPAKLAGYSWTTRAMEALLCAGALL